MKFSEFEDLMNKKGIYSLAEIARKFETTPQAVSNWKGRDQVPYHVVAEIKSDGENLQVSSDASAYLMSESMKEEKTISPFDLLLPMAKQLKLIFLISFISVFTTITYVKFIQKPIFESHATLLLPDNKANNLGGIANIASQFGVNIPTDIKADLSSPVLFPELIKSRTFAEKILQKRFYTKKYDQELSLLSILTHGVEPAPYSVDTLITMALGPLGEIIDFSKERTSAFSVLKVATNEPIFSKQLAEVVLIELEDLNRSLKSKKVSEKINFIQNRISSVNSVLIDLEKKLREFNERNRQLSSPSLKLEQERRQRDVEVQRGIYLTLKQQLELAKIEEVQEQSIVQVLDRPNIPLSSSNKNLKSSIMFSLIIGLLIGIVVAFIRSYLIENENNIERKKYRKIKILIKDKTKEIITDYRVTGILFSAFVFGLPFYLLNKSENPTHFNMYSTKLLIFNLFYIFTCCYFLILFLYQLKKNKK